MIVIGGTTIREHHLGSACSRSRERVRTGPSSNSTTGGMFSIASYLAEKISGFIPWMSTVGVMRTESREGSARRLEGVELGERARGMPGEIGGGGEATEEEEVVKLRKLLAEAQAREERSAKEVEELEGLREEVGKLRSQLGEERAKKIVENEGVAGKGKGVGEREVVGSVVEDPYSRAGDSVSEDKVIELLKTLNGGISEMAQTITRAFASVPRPPPRLPSEELSEDAKEAITGVAEILGPRMVELLQSPKPRAVQSEDEETVRMALKASMAAYTHWIISSWYFENPEDEHLLSEIYARVRETGK